MIKKRRAFICGIKGKKLSLKEVFFLKKYKPWGIILFSRNIHSIKQTFKLTQYIKKIFNDEKYPILIDEEGGRVSRLGKLIDNSIFTAEYFGKMYVNNKIKFNIYFEIYIKQISYLLSSLGVNLNTIPVLDLKRKNYHKVIGNRAYSENPNNVSKIGNICIDIFNKYRIGSIIKHIPGHGLAKVDSHNYTPYVNKSLKYLNKNDFYPFKEKKSIFAMTAHIIYKKLDPNNCVTHSKKMINLIRKDIGFKNIIISDDISMSALKYSISENTKKAFKAGCNLVLHCNANYKEMIIVAKNSPIIDNFILKKTSQFRDILS